MASTKIFTEMALSLILLLVMQQNIEATAIRDISSLLTELTNELRGQKQPLIFLINKNLGTLKKNKDDLNLGFSQETSDENAFHLVHNLIGHDKFKTKKRPQHKKSTPKPFPRDDKRNQRFRSQKQQQDMKLKVDRNVLRSPIVKKLLRISNSLRCEAKDECKDKCSNKYNGKQIINCAIQCEVKYVCDEEEQDNCEDGPCGNSCDRSAECQGVSTKGEKLVTEEPGCVRC